MIYRYGKIDKKLLEGHIPGEYLRYELSHNSMIYSSWTDSGSFVGIVTFEHEPGAGNTANLTSWFVDPEFRGMGFGEELLDLALDHLTIFYDAGIECVLPPKAKTEEFRELLTEHGFTGTDESCIYMEYTVDRLVHSNLMKLAPEMEKYTAHIRNDSSPLSLFYEENDRILASMNVCCLEDMIFVRKLVINDAESKPVIISCLLLDLAKKLEKSGLTDKKIFLAGKDESIVKGIRASFGDELSSVRKTILKYEPQASFEEETKDYWYTCSVRDITASGLYRLAMTDRNFLNGINGITFGTEKTSPVNRTTLSQTLAGELKSAGADLPEGKNDIGLSRFLCRGDRLEGFILGRKKEDPGYEIYGYTDINGDDRPGMFLRLLFSQITYLANNADPDETLDITLNTSAMLLILSREFGSYHE